MRKTIIFSFILMTAGLQFASQDTNTVVVNGLMFRACLDHALNSTSPELTNATSLRSPGISPDGISSEGISSSGNSPTELNPELLLAMSFKLNEHNYRESIDTTHLEHFNQIEQEHKLKKMWLKIKEQNRKDELREMDEKLKATVIIYQQRTRQRMRLMQQTSYRPEDPFFTAAAQANAKYLFPDLQ